MSKGPYKPGKNRVSASRLNETDALARKRLYVGPGLVLEDTASGRRLSLAKTKRVRGGGSSAEIRFGFVAATATTSMVLVQFLKYESVTDDNITRLVWSEDGAPRPAWLPPNFKSTDFTQLVRTSFNAQTPVVRLERIADVWFATWVERWAIKPLPSGTSVVRC